MSSEVPIDSQLRNMVQEMSELVASRSLLQYRINQLKLFNEQKTAFPKISEVKETQLSLIKLEKEINDTTNLLDSIQGSNEEEHLQALEDTYVKLKDLLEERQKEALGLEEEVKSELRANFELKNELNEVKKEGERLKHQLFQVKNAEEFRILKKFNDDEEEIDRNNRLNEEKKQQLRKAKFNYLSNQVYMKKSTDIQPETSYDGKTLHVPRLRLATVDLEKSGYAKSYLK
jgi:hypothetical protein